MIVRMEETKKCNGPCGLVRPITDFYLHSKDKKWRRSRCKICCEITDKKYREENGSPKVISDKINEIFLCLGCGQKKVGNLFWKSYTSKSGVKDKCIDCYEGNSIVPPNHRVCIYCEKLRPESDFYNSPKANNPHTCKECHAKYVKELYQDNDSNFKKQNKYNGYKQRAKKRNYEFSITFEQFVKFWQQPCYYCSQKIDTVGIDRVDNSKGYIGGESGNIVSCCQICNKLKNNFTLEELETLLPLIISGIKRFKNKDSSVETYGAIPLKILPRKDGLVYGPKYTNV